MRVARILGCGPKDVFDRHAKFVPEFERAFPKATEEFRMRLLNEALCIDCGTHWFIETEALAEKLPTMLKRTSVRVLDYLLQSADSSTGVIHTTGKSACSFLFCASRLPAGSYDRMLKEARMRGKTLHWIDSEPMLQIYENEEAMIISKSNFEELLKSSKTLRLFVSFIHYRMCFPDAIRDGFPDCAKHPAHYKGQCCRLVRHVEHLRDAPLPGPHYRKCHWRFLSNERFTKMRWTSILISETFVNGKAKTVVDRLGSESSKN